MTTARRGRAARMGAIAFVQAPIPISSEEPVGGRYELAERVGEGNFAVTYRAHDLVLGRTVAVKMLRAQYAADPTFVARFEREARVAASVSHPNVVDVYDFGAYRDTYFIAMQYAPGRTLKNELEARGPLPAADAVRIAGQILHGLGAIHAAGIVHRDIKPQNVLLGPDRVARVTDFGVAHYPVQGALTTHGTTVGTASYMAPEQARGAALSEATDLYAVGVVLFELLTGHLPFEGDNPMAVMLAHLQQTPPRPSEVAPGVAIPPALEAEVMRALAKDPSRRRPSADDMALGLDASLVESRYPDARLMGRNDSGTATMQIPVAAEARFPTGARAASATPSPAAVRSSSAAPAQGFGGASLPPVRARRRAAAWLAPVALFTLALAALGAFVASGAALPGLGGGGGDEATKVPVVAAADPTETASPMETATPSPSSTAEPPLIAIRPRTPTSAPAVASAPPLTAVPTPPPTATPTPTPTPPPTATPSPPPTATTIPRSTSTPTPTRTPEPLPTATATPTELPKPTATEEPIPEATETPEAVVVNQDPSGVVGRAVPGVAPTTAPPPQPITVADGDAEPAAVPVETDTTDAAPTAAPVERDGNALGFLSGPGVKVFNAREWQGATTASVALYGKPAVAIYGKESESSRATLTFRLQEPLGRMNLWLSGHGDETGTPFQFALEINGVTTAPITSPFPSWDGVSPSWSVVAFDIDRGLLRAGSNTVSVVSLEEGGHSGVPPYLLLAEASLAPIEATVDASAPASAETVRLTSTGPTGEGDAELAPKDRAQDPKNGERNDRGNANRGRGNSGGGGGDDGDAG